MAIGLSTIKPPSHTPIAASGPWGSFVICVGGTCNDVQYYIPPAPHNTTKYHINAASCGEVCPGVNMPAACSMHVCSSFDQIVFITSMFGNFQIV